jgi:hypothetical protein
VNWERTSRVSAPPLRSRFRWKPRISELLLAKQIYVMPIFYNREDHMHHVR